MAKLDILRHTNNNSHLNCGQRGRSLSGNTQRQQKHLCTETHACTALLTPSLLTYTYSPIIERTRPGPCAPSDLVPGQIDEALYCPSRSNNSSLALITRTRGDLQVLDSASVACEHAVLVPI